MTLQPCNLSCDSNYYLNWQTLAPPPISMQKLTHTLLRALPPPPLHRLNVWHLGSLKLPAPEAVDFLLLILPYVWIVQTAPHPSGSPLTIHSTASASSLSNFHVISKPVTTIGVTSNSIRTKFESEARAGAWLRSLHRNLDGPLVPSYCDSSLVKSPLFYLHSTSSILRCSIVNSTELRPSWDTRKCPAGHGIPACYISITVSASVDKYIATWNPASVAARFILTLFSHLLLSLLFGLFLSAYCTKILYAFLIYTRVLYIPL